jgi:succinyl-diaminopimelate desuccinylase
MDVARLCSDLVQIKSENPPGDTGEVVDYIADLLDSLGIPGTVTRHRGGRSNIFVNDDSHTLLLCGHVDVVPALSDGWTHDPFSGIREDGFVWGRGSTDMKGGCAAILAALSEIVERGEEPKVNLAFVCDEEGGGRYGIRHLLAKKLLHPCDCLVAEPTPPLHPSIGQKGLCRLHVRFRGTPGHGSLYPHVGVSAIMEALRLLEYLTALSTKTFRTDEELLPIFETSAAVLEEIFGLTDIRDVLRSITFNPGKIAGGEEINIVAQHCTLDLDMRIPWGCDIRALIDGIAEYSPTAEVKTISTAEPSFTHPETRIVNRIQEEIERVYHRRASPIVQWAASDSRFLRVAGFDAVEYGPGEITRLHAIDERVSIQNLHRASEIYTGLILRYIG